MKDAHRKSESTSYHARALVHPIIMGTLASIMISCSTPTDPGRVLDAAQIDPTTEKVVFAEHIKPLLQNSCLPCHDGSTAAGDLDLRSRQLAFRRSPNGPFIVPDHPERSKIFRMVRLAGAEPGAMPPTGHGLTEQQIALLKGWIAQGATWPEGENGHLKATTRMDWRSQ